MSFSFITTYPWWFLLLCPLAGFLAAGILYYSAIKKGDPDLKKVNLFLFAFRFVSVTVLVFLLFGPMLRKQYRETEKPVIVIAQDNSESLMFGKDSSFYRNEFKKSIEDLSLALEDKYEVQSYSFGDKVKEGLAWNFQDKQTDFSQLIAELESRYTNRNLGAVLISTDGIYNKGSNPLYAAADLSAPVFTIALGDTNPRKDVLISRIAVNRISYLGNTFPVEIGVEARKSPSAVLRVSVLHENAVLFSKEIKATSEFFSTTIPLQLEAKEAGVQKYSVRISPVKDELTVKNNFQDFYVDVLDSRQKILMLSAAPHPDLNALKQSIETSQAYQADLKLLDEPRSDLKQYNLVILHQLPFQNIESSEAFNQLKKAGIPYLVITGASSELSRFNSLGEAISFSDFKGRYNEVQAIFNKDFAFFTLSDELKSRIEKLPPLTSPFSTIKYPAGAQVLAFQKIGMVQTNEPLFVFTEQDGVRKGYITGEGLWKWRITDYALNGNQNAFNELIGKTVQFLSSRVDKSLFRVSGKNSFSENDAVEFEAELYNESYEPVNDHEVILNVYKADGTKFGFSFTKTSTAYRLNAGSFPPGEYRYEAFVKGHPKNLKAKGEFTVTPVIAEQINTMADHSLLNTLALQKAGKMYYPSQIEALKSDLLKREDITVVSYIQTTMQEIIEEKWIFILILIVLSVEWFIRKYIGLY